MRIQTQPAIRLLGLSLLLTARLEAAPGYKYTVVGNPADVTTETTGLLVLQGGGTDVDQNFVAMGAHSGGGDFVVIRASGTDASPGTMLFTLTGDVHREGVVELPLGTPLRALIEDVGGGVLGDGAVKAIVPGASTTALVGSQLDVWYCSIGPPRCFGFSLGG